MTHSLDRETLAQLALDAGLMVSGVASANPFHQARDYVVDHIERGYLSGFTWFTSERTRQSGEPRTLHEHVRSIVSVAIPYWSGEYPLPDDELRGKISRYAWGRDYHKTLKTRMKSLLAAIGNHIGRDLDARILSDTARAFDRAIAARAGVGWYGKNSMIIIPGHGSWAMLGEIYLDIEIEPDQPLTNNCGRCRFCIDKCPTGAIVEPYRVDANRCISYLTIEERGPIPRELRPLMGNWVFGCDVCQEVCPYTGAAQIVDDPAFRPASHENVYPSLAFLMTMSEEQFRATYSGTPVTRTKRRGMARNAAIALGNCADDRAEELLLAGLHHDEPLVRGHAAWALKHLTGEDAKTPLANALSGEPDDWVAEEIRWALENATRVQPPSRTLSLTPVGDIPTGPPIY